MSSKLVLITAAPGFSLIRANLKHIPPTHPPTTAQNQITIHLQMTFTCDKCSSLFPSRAALYSHNYDVHLEAYQLAASPYEESLMAVSSVLRMVALAPELDLLGITESVLKTT